MNLEIIFSGIAVIIALLTSVGLLLSRNWRFSLLVLAIQYIPVFWLVQLHWPIAMAAVKLVSGWMAASALGMTKFVSESKRTDRSAWPEGRWFRLITVALILITVLSVAPGLTIWLPGAGLLEVVGGLTLIGLGLLQLGLTLQPFRVILGLMTAMAGFEILYATVEISILVAALLASLNLSLALVGAYLLSIPLTEEAQ